MIATAEAPMPTELDFTDIYREHHRRVFNLCAYLLNSGDAAEDAAQEVFIRVQRKIDTYNPEFSLSNWILKIASNYCVDLLRKRGKNFPIIFRFCAEFEIFGGNNREFEENE